MNTNSPKVAYLSPLKLHKRVTKGEVLWEDPETHLLMHEVVLQLAYHYPHPTRYLGPENPAHPSRGEDSDLPELVGMGAAVDDQKWEWIMLHVFQFLHQLELALFICFSGGEVFLLHILRFLSFDFFEFPFPP